MRPSDADAELDENEEEREWRTSNIATPSDVHSASGRSCSARRRCLVAPRRRELGLASGDAALLGRQRAARGGRRRAGRASLHVRREAIARSLREPSELGLGRAWVAGELDVRRRPASVLLAQRYRLRDGPTARLSDARCALPRRLAAAGPSAIRAGRRPLSEARLRGRLHSLGARPARDPATTTTSPMRSTGSSSARRWSTRAPTSHVRGRSLETAQERKLELICRKLHLAPGERLLDVGCGWGSLVIHAATQLRRRARRRHARPAAGRARARARARGRPRDRSRSGSPTTATPTTAPTTRSRASAWSSTSAREQLGRVLRDDLRELLKPGGLLLNHGIVAPAPGAAAERQAFIWPFVFPDGELQPLSRVLAEMEQAGLEPRDTESLREHYALTLRALVANLDAPREEAMRRRAPSASGSGGSTSSAPRSASSAATSRSTRCSRRAGRAARPAARTPCLHHDPGPDGLTDARGGRGGAAGPRSAAGSLSVVTRA